MIWLVATVVVVVLFMRDIIKYPKKLIDMSWFKFLIYIVVWMLLVATLPVLPAYYIHSKLPKHLVEDKVISLAGVIAEDGSFFFVKEVSCVEPKKEMCYLFFVKNDRNYNSNEIFSNKATVYEEDRRDGLLKIYKEKFDKKSYWLVSYPFFDKYKRYEFFIPKGSLSRGD